MNIQRHILTKATLLLTIAGLSLSGCSDWLDVRPKSEIPTALHFERESGFRDQLTGVYTHMCETSMYGRDLTFGLASVLSQDYDLRTNSLYRYAAEYNYQESSTKSMIDAIWTNTYNCIANLNVMLEYIDQADPNIFSDHNQAVYKGEALGLRALLHLEMLRLFSPSPAANPQAKGVPYVTRYDKVITTQKTVSETLDLIIADLTQAMDLLQNDQSIYDKEINYKIRYARKKYFNYYAAIGMLARAYMYKGDKVNALKYAQLIIDNDQEDNPFARFVDKSSIETSRESDCDRAFSSELLFYLNIKDMDNTVKYYFTQSAQNNTLTPSDEKADAIFEKTSKGYGNDYRMLKGFGNEGDSKYIWKYHQFDNGRFNDIMPVLRKTEAYYIAAEVLKDTDPAQAVKLLNTVREARNLSTYPLSETLSTDEISDEIKKEYRKEFLAEGQMFAYYKRLNATTIDGTGTPAQGIYVLPMPDNEIEFGGRE